MNTRRWSGRKTQEHIETVGKINQWIPFFTRTLGWSLELIDALVVEDEQLKQIIR